MGNPAMDRSGYDATDGRARNVGVHAVNTCACSYKTNHSMLDVRVALTMRARAPQGAEDLGAEEPTLERVQAAAQQPWVARQVVETQVAL